MYEYVQQATTLQGYEFSLAYTPKVLNGIKGSMQTSYVVGKLNNNSYLPYMPPLCIKPKVEFQKNIEATKKVFACIWINAYSQQYKLAPTEKSTPAFTLCNLLVAFELKSRQLATTVSIGCNNLFNETYFSHLSRIKNFGYNNMGRNIFFNLKIKSTKSLKL